ncbi:MAG: prephenate dehydratase [Bacillota bacterium]
MKKKCAYLGPPGTFSELAVINYCTGEDEEIIPYDSIRELVEAVNSNEVDIALLPLENSLEGSVNISLDLLFENEEVEILKELVLPIEHFLLTPEKKSITEIKTVYSHPQAIAQSEKFLSSKMPQAKLVSTESTAAAAKKVAEDKKGAAIGSFRLAEIYDLEITASNLEGELPNSTRFVIIGRRKKFVSSQNNTDAGQKKRYKTSIICTPKKNRAGVLHDILGEFARREIDLSRIESRPTRKKLGEYMFYIDLAGKLEDENLKKSLKEVEKKSGYFRILGSYQVVKLLSQKEKKLKKTEVLQ